MYTTLKILNEKTGELEDKEFTEKPKRRTLNKDWFGMRSESLARLLNEDLQAGQLRVMLALCSLCNWKNIVRCKRKDILCLAKVSEPYGATSLRLLAERGYIIRSSDDPNYFEIDPMLCWRGNNDEWAPASRAYFERIPADCFKLSSTIRATR